MIARRMSWAGTALLSLAICLPAVAQAPPGAPGGGGGGMAQFQKFREQHKYTFQLQRMIRGLGEIDKDPSTKLTADQAKGLMGVLKPWQTKDKMTQDDAKNVMKSTKKLLTTKQLNALSRIPDRRPGGGGGMGGPGGGGPGGGPGGAPGFGGPGGGPPGAPGRPPGGVNGSTAGRPGGGRGFDMARMKNFNPLSTKVDPNNPRSERRADRNKRMFTMLAQRANAKTTAAKK